MTNIKSKAPLPYSFFILSLQSSYGIFGEKSKFGSEFSYDQSNLRNVACLNSVNIIYIST